MRRLLTVAVVLAVVGMISAVVESTSTDEPKVGEARLELDGTAIVERRDGAQQEIDNDTDLRAGDRVEITGGTGRLVLRDGVRMELREGLGDAANSMVRMGTTPVLEAGDLLVAAPREVSVSAGGSTVAVQAGAARLSRALGVGVASYDGMVRLDSAGLDRMVPALREMQVPALGRPPRAPRPLDYRAGDPWDRRFLGAAIDLGRTLEALANGYTQNLNPGEGRTPGFFRLVLPALDDEPTFDGALIDLDRAPGETLIGAAIAELGERGTFTERWQSVFDFRDDGAEWGLVALDQDVSGTPLLGTIEQAVASSPLAFAPSPPGRGGSDEGSTPGGGTPPPTTSPPTTRPPTTPPPTTPPPTTPPPTVPPPPESPLSPVLDPVIEPVNDLVSGLVGGLLGGG